MSVAPSQHTLDCQENQTFAGASRPPLRQMVFPFFALRYF
jgi:hypothetical protein